MPQEMEIKDNKYFLDIKTESFFSDFFDLNLYSKTTNLGEETGYDEIFWGSKKKRYDLDLFNETLTRKQTPNNKITDRLDVIVDLISNNSINKNEYIVLRDNQEEMLVKLTELQSQNRILLDNIDTIKAQNLELKYILKKNTSDKLLRKISNAFLLFFSISLITYYISDYELIKLIWAKFGVIISFVIYLIGFFVGKLVNKIEIT